MKREHGKLSSQERLWRISADLELDSASEFEKDILGDLENLDLLRQALKEADDVSMPENGAYFDALENRIMSTLDERIEQGDVRDRAFESEIGSVVARGAAISGRRRSISRRPSQFAFLAGLALLATTGKWLTAQGTSEIDESASVAPSSAASQLRSTHQAAPRVLTGTVMSFESDTDLALEIAARRLVAYHKGE